MRLTKLSDAPVADILHVCRNMRQADREEIHATRGDDSDDLFARELLHIDGSHSWVCYLERPIAIVGIVPMWPGVWTAWMIATDEFNKIGLAVTRRIKRDMIPTLRAKGAHRCEARSAASHTWAHRWLEACGATPEATLEGYGKGGEDFIIYRWR